MVSVQSILAIVFFIVMFSFLIYKRKKLSYQKVLFPLIYVIMYRTKLGLKLMNKLAHKIPFLGYIIGSGVVIGFLGMIFICFEIIRNSVKLLFSPGAAVSVQPVLPFEAKGVFFVPFVYWILAIFIIATIHEFSHGVAARYFGMKLKSSGFAFLCLFVPIVPAAFVEPDEKNLAKSKLRQRLGVFAAGPFSNILTAGVVLILVLLVFNPVSKLVFESSGVEIVSVTEDGPSALSGLSPDDILMDINGVYVGDVNSFVKELRTYSPGDTINIKTNNGIRTITLGKSPSDESLPWMGISSRPYTVVRESVKANIGEFIPIALEWIFGFFYWLFLLSLGIGLFNLLPMGPLDGGLMVRSFFKDYFKQRGVFVFRIISWFFFILILVNIGVGFVR
ncbi:site-2 protease family protein [Candidatus Woesearchaeota archaeon]|nr:site-2 protease family protein [Candidatus Woesearchaeota archaeon]